MKLRNVFWGIRRFTAAVLTASLVISQPVPGTAVLGAESKNAEAADQQSAEAADQQGAETADQQGAETADQQGAEAADQQGAAAADQQMADGDAVQDAADGPIHIVFDDVDDSFYEGGVQEDVTGEADLTDDAGQADTAVDAPLQADTDEAAGQEAPLLTDEEDAFPVGDDDSDMEGDEDEIGILKYDEAAVVSALSGLECDNSVFSAAAVLTKGEPSVKLSWKLKGAKYFSLDSLRVDGTYETIAVRTNKKSYIDYAAFDTVNNMHLYKLKAFDALGAQIAQYVTIPSVSILSADMSTAVGKNKIVFTKLGEHYKYTLERSKKKKITEPDRTYVIYADDEMDGKNTDIYSKAVSGVTLKMDSLSFEDTDGRIEESKACYYRVKPTLDIQGFDIAGSYSAISTVKQSKYAAPIITRISRYFNEDDADEDEKSHDLCADNGNIYVRFEGGLPSNVKIDEAELVVYRAGVNGKYKKITSEIVDDLTTALDGNKKVNYVIPYDNFPPGETFSYKAAVSYKGLGAFSAPFQRTCDFNDVEIVSAGEHSYNSVKLTWKSDPCATRYNIYRSIDTWDNIQAAQDAMESLEKDRFKKIKTVKNTTPREGTEISFIDSGKLEVGMYHIYRIVPVNKKEGDFVKKTTPLALKAFPASPEEVFVYPVNRHSMDIVWSSANNAVVYKIQRTDTISGGEPVFSDEKGVDFREWEYKATGSGSGAIKKVHDDDDITDDFGKKCVGYNYINVSVDSEDESAVKMGKSYYYRIVAACKVGQAVIWADEEAANWTEAHTQLAGVRNMSATLYSRSTTDGTNVVQIGFKAVGKESSTRIDDIYDYEMVDHYEIVTATSERGLDTASVMTIDGRVFTYTEGSTQKSVNIIDNPGTLLFKNVRKIKRGQAYYMGVRTVYKDDTQTIYGNWKKLKFVLPVEVFVYPEGSSRHATNSDNTRYEIASAAKKNFILDFEPYDTTYTDVDIVLTTEAGSAFTKTYDSTQTLKSGYHYFTVTAPTVYSTSTIIPKSKITVTARKKDAVGDIKSQLIKYYYLKSKKASSTTS